MANIFDYIAETLKNKTAALKQIEDFQKAFENVCLFPFSHPFIENEYVSDKSLRKVVVNNYIAFYKVNDLAKTVDIVRVLYGMMNFENLL